MTFMSKKRRESEQEGLEELATKALRTRPNLIEHSLPQSPHPLVPSHLICFSQQTVWQIPSWNTNFLVSLGNKDLAPYELHRTTSCIQMAVQTVRKWVSSALSSAALPITQTKMLGECISYRVRRGRRWTQVNKGNTTDHFLLPQYFQGMMRVGGRLVSYLSLNAREVDSCLHFVTQDSTQPVSRSPQRQYATARVIFPLLPAAQQQLFRKYWGTEAGRLSISSSAWAMITLFNTCLVKLISWSTYQDSGTSS